MPEGRCAWDGTPLVPEPLAGPSIALGDVTGDGIDDWLTHTPEGRRVIAGPWPGVEHATIADPEPGGEYFVRAFTGDLDDDGAPDLVLARPWRGEVAVFFGPVAADAVLDLTAPPFGVTSPPEDFSDLFGIAAAIANVTGDGVADLVLGAPAEGEEGCFGTHDTGIWPGPLGPGHSTLAEAPRHIAAPQNTCLGSAFAVVDVDGEPGDELLVGGQDEARAYALPLAEPPVEVRTIEGYYWLGAGDLDGDGRGDFVFQSGNVVFGDGHTAALDIPPNVYRNVSAPQPWLERDVALVYESQTDALRAHDGAGEAIEDLPVVAHGTFEDQWVSTADLDHDGRADLIVGDKALRCGR
ncbi:FG-GAP repeat protein [Nannocystis pusilla]|uniref:FG-GAP repeat protein n=1 Tax=Nannocystis pusilla TaxID=889268 RepID=UPI003DA5E3EA